MRALLTLAALQLSLAPAAAGPPRPAGRGGPGPAPTAEQIIARLEARVPEVRFQNKPLREVLEWFAKQLGVNLWVRWNVLVDYDIRPDTPVTIEARNVRLSHALWMALRQASPTVTLRYGLVENILVVSTRSDLSNDIVTQVYDVRPLLGPRPAFGRPPAVRLSGEGKPRIEMPPDQPQPAPAEHEAERIQRLIAVIHNTIEPDAWVQNGGEGTIDAFDGKLIVRADLATQLQVRQLLFGLAGTR